MPTKKRLLDKGFNIGMSYEGIEEMRNNLVLEIFISPLTRNF